MRKYITKVERRKRNHWNRNMWRRNKGDWAKALIPITNQYLKVKVACVILWDSQDDKLKEGRDFSYLKSLADKYRPIFEEGYNQDELEQTLINAGYPKRIAKVRATPPKGWEYERQRRMQKKAGKKCC